MRGWREGRGERVGKEARVEERGGRKDQGEEREKEREGEGELEEDSKGRGRGYGDLFVDPLATLIFVHSSILSFPFQPLFFSFLFFSFLSLSFLLSSPRFYSLLIFQ